MRFVQHKFRNIFTLLIVWHFATIRHTCDSSQKDTIYYTTDLPQKLLEFCTVVNLPFCNDSFFLNLVLKKTIFLKNDMKVSLLNYVPKCVNLIGMQ